MKRKMLALALGLVLLLGGKVSADEVRYQYDYNFPQGSFSLEDFRSSLRGLHQGDLMPLQPKAKLMVDEMEYGSSASAAASYSGTGVTITTDSLVEEEGSYCLKAVIDGTGNREFSRSLTVNLESFTSIKLWERSSGTSDAIKFYVEDSSGNQSYWDITTNGSADTWQQDTLTVASPDGNNGTDADLTDITDFGFQSLDASTTYYFDTTKALSGMNIVVKGTNLGDYYRNVAIGIEPLEVDAQVSPTLTAPSSNPRIDILTIDTTGTLSWVEGTESSSPVEPWDDVPTDEIPICLVYLKTTMTQVLDYEDKDVDTNQGYIYKDVRPLIGMSSGYWRKGADIASASSIALGTDGTMFDITGTTSVTSITAKTAGFCTFLQFDGALTVVDGSNLSIQGNFTTAAGSTMLLCSDGTNWVEFGRSPTANDFTTLTDTPAGYSGHGSKFLRVNSGETAVEFDTLSILDASDTPSSFTANYYWRTNSGGTAVEQVEAPEDSTLIFASAEFPASVSRYVAPGGGGISSDVAAYKVPMPVAGTAKNLYVRTGTAASNTIVVTVYKNGIATGLGATIATSAYENNNTGSTVSFSAGDDMSFRVQNNRTSAYDVCIMLEYEM